MQPRGVPLGRSFFLKLAEQALKGFTERAHAAVVNAAFTTVPVMLGTFDDVTVSLGRGWRTKKSNIRVDAEARAREVIKEDYQKLGPTK